MAYSFYARAYTIDYKVLPADATDKIVTWTINDEAIATVDEYGTVIFSTPGEVVITGHLKSGKSRDFRLKAIEGPLPSPEDVLAPSLIEMDIDEEKALVVSTKPDLARIRSYSYSSSDESIVEVDDYVILKAKAPGKMKVIVKTLSGFDEEEIAFEKKVTIIVSDPDIKPEPGPSPSSKPDPVPDEKPAYRIPLTGIE